MDKRSVNLACRNGEVIISRAELVKKMLSTILKKRIKVKNIHFPKSKPSLIAQVISKQK